MSAIELAQKLLQVQSLLNSIEVHGYTNTSSITHAYEICTDILNELKKTIEEIQNESKEEGVSNGESD